MIRIAIDLDDTLWKAVIDEECGGPYGVGSQCACGVWLKQVVDEDLALLIEEMIPLVQMKLAEIFIWSAGGEKYVEEWMTRFRPHWKRNIKVIAKEGGQKIDVTIDDQAITLGKLNLMVIREHADHWQMDKAVQP